MRYFLAIPLPEDVKQKLHHINISLSKYKNLRLVNPDNMHLTLLFLGNTNGVGEKVLNLKNIKFNSLSLKSSKISLFPEKGKVRLVWVELEDSPELKKLQKEVSTLFGINQEYRPHITLARVKDLDKKSKSELIETIQQIPNPKLNIEVKNFKLYSSELTVLGPVHRVIEYFESSSKKIVKKTLKKVVKK